MYSPARRGGTSAALTFGKFVQRHGPRRAHERGALYAAGDKPRGLDVGSVLGRSCGFGARRTVQGYGRTARQSREQRST